MYSSGKWIIVNIYDEDYHLFEDTIDIKTVIIIPLPGARVICDAISMTGSATEGVSCSRCTCTSECLSGRTTRRHSRSPEPSSVILDDVLLVFPASQRNGRKRLMTTWMRFDDSFQSPWRRNTICLLNEHSWWMATNWDCIIGNKEIVMAWHSTAIIIIIVELE